MIALAIKMLLGRWIADATGEIKAQWRWITATPVHMLLVALILSIAINFWLWHTGAACAAHAAAVDAAQKRATAAQITVNQAPARNSATIARKSDEQAPAYAAAVSAAVSAHSVIMRAPASGGSAADLPRTDQAAKVDDSPAAHADLVAAADVDLVCRPKDDDSKIITAAKRGVQAHQDALDLITSGAAVADDE